MKGRLTKPQLVAVIADPAISATESPDILSKYMMSRDLSLLPIDLEKKINAKTGEPVAMFKLKSLDRKDSATLAELVTSRGVTDLEANIVRQHIEEFYNYEDEDGNRLPVDVDKTTGITCITQDGIKKVDDEVIKELGTYMVDIARGANGDGGRPFSLPVGWLEVRTRSRGLPVNVARLDKAANSTANQPTAPDGDQDQK